MIRQFNDVVYNGAFRTSDEARQAIIKLRELHGLHFIQNPGGGEFYNDHIRVQVTLCDDVADYHTLATALAEAQ